MIKEFLLDTLGLEVADNVIFLAGILLAIGFRKVIYGTIIAYIVISFAIPIGLVNLIKDAIAKIYRFITKKFSKKQQVIQPIIATDIEFKDLPEQPRQRNFYINRDYIYNAKGEKIIH